jgi:xylulokinase
MHAIGIDVGTTNVKVVMVDPLGSLLADSSRPLATRAAGDGTGQDADELWGAVASAVREVTAARPEAAGEVATIGVCSQYSSLVPVGPDGSALAPIKLYLDDRGAGACWEVLERHPEAFETWVARHGIPPIGGGLTLSHLLHFQLDEPELHAATRSYLEVMDLVNLRLTGTVAATQCTMFASQLCDNRTVGTTRYDDDLVAMAGVDADRLPPLVAVDGDVGEVRDDVAAHLGLPRGVVVRAGMNDTQAGAFATGALSDPARCGLVVGTTAVLIRSMPAFGVDLDHEILSMPVPLPGRYVVMAENGIAGRAVEHALELLSPGATGGDERFAELEAALGSTDPGAGGLLFLPWLAGSMSPSSSSRMRGGFLGLTLSTRRAQVLRATVEGVARNLRWLAPWVDRLAGSPSAAMCFAGGAARSSGVAATLADVLDTPVGVPDRPELAAARAVALVAAHRGSGDEAAAAAAPTATEHRPDPDATAVHDRLQPLFEDAFSANVAICQALGS